MKNYMEDVVLEVLEEVLQVNPDFCRCPKCKQDVVLIALSKIKGRYASSPVGEIFARVEQSDRQVRTDALLAVMQALEQVAAYPRHDGPTKLTEK
ncbi:late competence development ComFB family protein [Capillibacterium thermochitinicola]|uniref:Late competence development ComFB family protein n=1 Tax=Capillibacterium thermochitinicola TaxID=2699427 RepID=A0A8J6HY67_9FIRM|nr:late competence development ComFB family protein [Capillibacterium thermochitinicola]MBA2132011.1 late competence development ComFB family protein [Capillibacterium thermochitinicola]